jgi:hypothetical protein
MKKSTLFIIAIVGVSLLSKEAIFIIAVLYLLYCKNFTKRTRLLLLPIFTLVCIGIAMGYHYPKNDILRDAFIVTRIIVFFWVGVVLAKKVDSWDLLFKYLKTIALISALYHIGVYFIHYGSADDLDHLRKETGTTSYVESVLTGIIFSRIWNKNFNLEFNKRFRLFSLQGVILLTSFILYQSRTMLITSFIIVLFLCNWLNLRIFWSRANFRFFRVAAIFAGVLYLLLTYTNGTLTDKIRNIPEEMLWNSTRMRHSDAEDINMNWRGYEAYKGMIKYMQGNQLQHIAGFGFGSRVDLGLTIKLGGEPVDTIPILHNGYVMLLIKCGWIGLMLYMIFLYRLGIKRKSGDFYCLQFLSALVFATILNTFSVAGLLNENDPVMPILLGMFWKSSQIKT